MKKNTLKIILVILTALSLVACNQETFTPEFLESDTLRLEVGKTTIFTYDDLTCQLAFNRDRMEFRVHTDVMSEYYIVKFEELPVEEGQEVVASSLAWTTRSGQNAYKTNITLQVVKLEGDTVWLWNSRESIKLTVKFLE